MDKANVETLFQLLDANPNWIVLDVGAHEQPLLRADWAIDLLPYDGAGAQGVIEDHVGRSYVRHICPERWIEMDICSERWPFKDKSIDFAVCSNVLEDVRDPLFVISELNRVAKAGYIEVPRPGQELLLGVDSNYPEGRGYWHHRWFIGCEKEGLKFLAKHASATYDDTIPDYMTGFEPTYWENTIDAVEVLPLTYLDYIITLKKMIRGEDV